MSDRPGRPGSTALSESAVAQLRTVLAELAADPASLSSVTDPERAWSVHVADSLSGLEVKALAAARSIADVGSGAGFPGIVLAAALPAAAVDLIESVRRKCEFIEAALSTAGIGNARPICDRAERWAAGDGREAYDAVTARAVGRLATIAELASPLLCDGGHLVCWKGRRVGDEEDEVERAAEQLAMSGLDRIELDPIPGRAHRHLYVLRKDGPTPQELPRRPGIAKKRPYGRR